MNEKRKNLESRIAFLESEVSTFAKAMVINSENCQS